jgi:uncharacterized protein YceK
MRNLRIVLAAGLLVSGCASQHSRVMLDALTQDCQAGNQDSCAQVPAQQAAVAAEQQQNATTALEILGAAAAIGGTAAIISNNSGGSHYVPAPRYPSYRRY